MGSKRSKALQNMHRVRIAKTRSACHICGQPIDYTLKWPDSMSFVVDHVVPISRGGSDEIGNKRASHAVCNARKQASPESPNLKRSGTLN